MTGGVCVPGLERGVVGGGKQGPSSGNLAEGGTRIWNGAGRGCWTGIGRLDGLGRCWVSSVQEE